MALSFVADENVETEIVDSLRKIGHHTVHVAYSTPGAEDESILHNAYNRGYILPALISSAT